MKHLIYLIPVALCIACSGNADKNITETITTTKPVENIIPLPDSSWQTVSCDKLMAGLVVSAPKTATVWVEDGQIGVVIDSNIYLGIKEEQKNLKDDKQFIIENQRTDIEYIFDTDTELFYTCLDHTAPEGFQRSNSFSTCKKIGDKYFSSYVDGISIHNASTKDIYNLPMDQAKLLLGIWRTLRIDDLKK